MGSILYGTPLLPPDMGTSATMMNTHMPFVKGPALIYDTGIGSSGGQQHASSSSSSSNNNVVVVFGGNSILKALALVGTKYGSVYNSTMDEWLEYERCVLRPILSSNVEHSNGIGGEGNKKYKKGLEEAFSKIESALLCNGGLSVVAAPDNDGAQQHVVTPADVAIALTILHYCVNNTGSSSGCDANIITSWGGLLSSSPTIRSYVEMTILKSDTYNAAIELAKSLVPPRPPPSYDANDPSLLNACSAIFAKAILSIFPMANTFGKGVELRAYKCKDSKHGDYQCNIAMSLYQKLNALGGGLLPIGVTSPQSLAQCIIDVIVDMDELSNPVICDLSINGPGFIMCRIKTTYLEVGVNSIIQDGKPTRPKCCTINNSNNNNTAGATAADAGDDDVVVVDFSSPNIAKEMHVGHLRSTIIGESVSRILEYAGKHVKRVNHVGDWGTQFGMLIQYLKEEYPDVNYGGGSSDADGMPNITDLTEFYKNAKSRFDESSEFKKIAQLNVVKLQSGDDECHRIWKMLCDISRLEFDKVYKRLDITVEECGESFYNDKIPPVIDEFIQRDMMSVEEGGAKCVFVPQFKVPLMLQKSDGGYGYDSTDMAAIKYRLDVLKARHIVYITDFTQADHFKMVFAAAKKIGWVNDDTHRLDHIGFGTVQGEDGKRFKTRSGDTVRLVDLLDEAVSRMELSLRERASDGRANAQGSSHVTEDEVHETACAMGYGAVKYFDLRRNPTSNYIFSYDRMLDTKGNTAIYLLYAHARLESIVTKGTTEFGIDVDELMAGGTAKIVLSHKSERNLALNLRFFADSIEETLKDLFPYHICDFVYDLSIASSEFVTQCKVLGSPEMESRLLLCRATAITMRQCFDLLGIRHVMRI
jgi:arginyl-tRNA synthetase